MYRFRVVLSGICVLTIVGCGGTSDRSNTTTAKKSASAPPQQKSQKKPKAQTRSSTTTKKNTFGGGPSIKITPPNSIQDGKATNQKKQTANKTDGGRKKAAAPNKPIGSQPTPKKKSPSRLAGKKKSPGNTTTGTTKKDPQSARQALEQSVANFKVPPDWLANVRPTWSTQRPWKEARQEIRRLLGTNDERQRKQAIKLTWQYLQKRDIGNGHEYGMYMFLGKEPIWAVIAYRDYVNRPGLKYPPYFGLKALAAIYVTYGVFDEAEKLLKRGLGRRPPDKRWAEVRKAEMHDALGDLYAAWEKLALARQHYGEAIRLFPLGKPPYGRHLLPRQAKKVRSKLDLLSMGALGTASLRDGQFRAVSRGYSGDIDVRVQIRGGRIAKVTTRHKEKIDQNACIIIPQRIVAKQSLKVDSITGATVTKNAIIDGALQALRRAGLK